MSRQFSACRQKHRPQAIQITHTPIFDEATLSHITKVVFNFHFHTVLAFTQALTKHTHDDATLSRKGRAPKCPRRPPRRRRRVQHRISRGTNNSRTATAAGAAAAAAAAATTEAGRHGHSFASDNHQSRKCASVSHALGHRVRRIPSAD